MMSLTMEQYTRLLKEPALCEQLNMRDLLDNVAVQLNGSLVAGYELSGLHSYYGSDEERNRTKGLLEALLRSLPERSMRLQLKIRHHGRDRRPHRPLPSPTAQSKRSASGPRPRPRRELAGARPSGLLPH